MLTVEQAAQGWFAQSSNSANASRRALGRLERAGLVERRTLEAHPFLPMQRPLFAWKVGDPPPRSDQWDAIASRSQERWTAPHVAVEVWLATKRAAHAFGAFVDARRARHSEATHDLHLSQVFLRYRLRKPRLAEQWLGEGAFPKLGFDIRGMKDPDAFLLDGSGAAYRIVEFGGSYDADHLQAFHAHCSGQAAEKLARHIGTRPVAERPTGVRAKSKPPNGAPHNDVGPAGAQQPALRLGPSSRLMRLYARGGTDYELW
jgi:hypothetical protein